MSVGTTGWRRLAVAFAMVALSAVAIVYVAGPTDAAERVRVPAGMDAGIAVYDRAAGRFTYRWQATKQFRSASLVKLLIALDLTWDPAVPLPEEDRARLDLMLRSSDDAAASAFWSRNGRGAIVERMVARLGLQNTTPPPPNHSGWGSTGVSAEDLVRVYRYVLEEAPAQVRDLVMGNLSNATKCGTDGFDQSFGIRSAFTNPTAVKQGWVNFGDAPRNPCVAAAMKRSTQQQEEEIDYSSGALHTTGTVGAGSRTVVVVLSTHLPGTSYAQAGYALTKVVRSLPVPDARLAPPLPKPEPGLWFATWSSGVGVYAATSLSSERVNTVPTRQEVRVACQVQGEEVVRGSVRNDWWTYLPELGGYMSNIFFEWSDNQLPADVVPLCSSASHK
jgi:hypothetical protein